MTINNVIDKSSESSDMLLAVVNQQKDIIKELYWMMDDQAAKLQKYKDKYGEIE